MEVTIFDKSSIQIIIDSTIYSSQVVHKCFYWYSGMCTIDIRKDEKLFFVKMEDLKQEWDIQIIIGKIKTDLIDFKTREIITNETKNIRDMLVAKAFAYNDEFEEQPKGEINDPIGFDPSIV